MGMNNDLFSKAPDDYYKYRPRYPKSLYDQILEFVPERDLVWDVGCGSGQVSTELSQYFEHVIASDVSAEQLKRAPQLDNITYVHGSAEQTKLEGMSVDLITVGQALHWFDLISFFNEGHRVLKRNGILAYWGYGLLRSEAPVSQFVDEYYHALRDHWPKERQHVEEVYKNIAFPESKFQLVRHFQVEHSAEWSVDHLEGYLRSWSAHQLAKKEEDVSKSFQQGLTALKRGLRDVSFEVRFPIFCYILRVIT